MRIVPIASLLVVFVVCCAGASAIVEMTGQLKSFAGSRARVGLNKISVVSKPDSSTRPIPESKVKPYTKPIPSPYHFEALSTGIAGKLKKFAGRRTP